MGPSRRKTIFLQGNQPVDDRANNRHVRCRWTGLAGGAAGLGGGFLVRTGEALVVIRGSHGSNAVRIARPAASLAGRDDLPQPVVGFHRPRGHQNRPRWLSGSNATAAAIGDAMESGMVGVNSIAISTPETPFGGVKESGHGSEGGVEGLGAYFNTKFISQA